MQLIKYYILMASAFFLLAHSPVPLSASLSEGFRAIGEGIESLGEAVESIVIEAPLETVGIDTDEDENRREDVEVIIDGEESEKDSMMQDEKDSDEMMMEDGMMHEDMMKKDMMHEDAHGGNHESY